MIARILGLVCLMIAANAMASPDHSSWNADSPSFNCKAEHLSSVEARICDAKNDLWNSDRAIAVLYKEASERLDSEHRKVLTLQQQHWLKTRERCTERDCITSAYDTRSGQIWKLILADANGRPVPVLGGTPQDRIAYLRFIQNYYDSDTESRNRYYFPGLKDSDADVRSFVAFSLHGPSYTGLLIDLLVVEPDVDVRMSLAISISCELTCNGTESCAEASTVEEHLDNLLRAYKQSHSEPAGYGEEELDLQHVLTNYNGEDDSSKCLSPKAQQRIRDFLSQS